MARAGLPYNPPRQYVEVDEKRARRIAQAFQDMPHDPSDPNVRMQQLLYQSEDLRQIGQEWRRFWFNDQPSHLTPERIHGGII